MALPGNDDASARLTSTVAQVEARDTLRAEGIIRRGSELWDRFETALVEHDFDRVVSLFADDAVYVEPAGRHEGRAAIRAWLDQWGEAVSDTRFETLLVVADGDVIIAERAGTGTHTGPPLTALDGPAVPSSGKTVVFPGVVTILRVDAGKIVEVHEYFDQLTILRQLGLVPGM
jgi:steroid delta-isomerase-like uncharacterized protein